MESSIRLELKSFQIKMKIVEKRVGEATAEEEMESFGTKR
jgi:hypothetical protein